MARRTNATKRGTPAPGRELRELAYDGVELVLLAATCAWLVHVALDAGLAACGVDLDGLRDQAVERLGTGGAALRLGLFGAVLAGVLPRVWRGWRWLRARAEKAVVPVKNAASRVDVAPGLRAAARAGAHLGVGALLAVVLLQPTLVGPRIDATSWLERAANFVDGTASAYVADSVVAVARWLHPVPVRPEAPVSPDAFDATLDAAQVPLMDRWDALLREASDGDPEIFAQTKAFMWVESGGRQYALSATGCAGLMQFCATTATRKPFAPIFGTGQVAACGCDDCSVPFDVQVALETDASAVDRYRDTFPCDLSDARFDAERSIRASVAYVRELSKSLEGELLVMYVGYNAGPTVARDLLRRATAAGRAEDLRVEHLRPHLAAALRPHYGSRAEPRANGLLDVHLPKLLAAYERWSSR